MNCIKVKRETEDYKELHLNFDFCNTKSELNDKIWLSCENNYGLTRTLLRTQKTSDYIFKECLFETLKLDYNKIKFYINTYYGCDGNFTGNVLIKYFTNMLTNLDISDILFLRNEFIPDSVNSLTLCDLITPLSCNVSSNRLKSSFYTLSNKVKYIIIKHIIIKNGVDHSYLHQINKCCKLLKKTKLKKSKKYPCNLSRLVIYKNNSKNQDKNLLIINEKFVNLLPKPTKINMYSDFITNKCYNFKKTKNIKCLSRYNSNITLKRMFSCFQCDNFEYYNSYIEKRFKVLEKRYHENNEEDIENDTEYNTEYSQKQLDKISKRQRKLISGYVNEARNNFKNESFSPSLYSL